MAVEEVLGDVFDRGVEYGTLRPLGRRDWLLIYTRAGAGEIRWPGGQELLEPGSAVLFSPGAYQHYATARSTRRWNLLWAHFGDPAWSDLLEWPEVGPGIGWRSWQGKAQRGEVEAAMLRAIRWSHVLGGDAVRLAWNGLEEVFLLARRGGMAGKGARLTDRRITAVLESVAGRWKQQPTVAEMARKAGLSPSRFAHLFQQQMGESPRAYLEALRLRHAARLLRATPLQVREVAEHVGFEDPFYFCNRFRAKYGCSPRAYRRKG